MFDQSITEITSKDVKASIESIHYFTAGDAIQYPESISHCEGGGFYLDNLQHLTFCVIRLHNGYIVTGQSICMNAEVFDAEKGRIYAREDAMKKVYPLLAFLVKQDEYEDELFEEATFSIAEAQNQELS